MSNFDEAVNYILAREGGLSENPNDSGGITNFGVSLRFLREVPQDRLRRYSIFEPVTEQTIRDLVVEQAKTIYKGEFWNEAPFENIESQKLCNYYFDMAIVSGVHQATKLLQRSIWASQFDRTLLRDDGLLGERTVGYVNAIGEELLPILVAVRASFYRLIAELRPKDKANLSGWLNRCYRVD